MKAIYQKIVFVAICAAVGYCIWRYYRNHITKSNLSLLEKDTFETTNAIKDICNNLDFDSQTNNNQKNNCNQSNVLAILDENTDIAKYLK